jgi:hypothetical protein
MTEEKKQKEDRPKIKLFDYIFESSIKSSKTIQGIVAELILLAEDIRSLHETMLALSKVIQVHQGIIEDICIAFEHAAKQAKKDEILLPTIKDSKKDKLN